METELTSKQLSKLQTLLPDELSSSLLNLGILAGGSAVYVLCDWVKLSTVSDLDFFFTTKWQMEAAMRLVSEYKAENRRYFAVKKSVRTIHICGYLPIQFILTTGKNALELISSFDLDYVQCGIQFIGNKIMASYTARAVKSHQDRKIYEIGNEQYQIDRLALRLSKACYKGFTLNNLPQGFKLSTLGLSIYCFKEIRDDAFYPSSPDSSKNRNDWTKYFDEQDENKSLTLYGQKVTDQELMQYEIFPFDRINYEDPDGLIHKLHYMFIPLKIGKSERIEVKNTPQFVDIKKYLTQKPKSDTITLSQPICITDELGDIFGELKIMEDKILSEDVFSREKLRLRYKLEAYKLLVHGLDIDAACKKVKDGCKELDLTVISTEIKSLKHAKVYIDTSL
jgi:hypothetical protein